MSVSWEPTLQVGLAVVPWLPGVAGILASGYPHRTARHWRGGGLPTSLEEQPLQHALMRLIGLAAKEHNCHLLQASLLFEVRDDRTQSDRRRLCQGIAKGSGAQRGEGNALQVILFCQIEAGLVGALVSGFEWTKAGKATGKTGMSPIWVFSCTVSRR